MYWIFVLALTSFARLASAHIAIWHPSMWGFNVTAETFSYDNRPVSPLAAMNFTEWWFHNHLAFPPHPEDVFELPAGQIATAELGCNKGATSFFASSEGGDIRSGDDPCPGSPMAEYHTRGPDDVKGCALAIAYKNGVDEVKPEDFTVFSVNQSCVLHRFTDFAVPVRMPACPDGQCICAWFWIHSPDSGGEQNYMNGFQCNVTGSISTVPLAKPQIARRCGADPDFERPLPVPGNCTYGAKQPFYWFQDESNNMFEGTFAPPFYLDLYNFLDGAQDDIFDDSYIAIPNPGPNQTVLPLLNQAVAIPGQVLKLPNAALVNMTGLTIASAPGAGSIVPAPSIPSPPPASLISSAVSQPPTTYTIATLPLLDTDPSSSLTPTDSTSIVGLSPTSTSVPPSASPPLILLNPGTGSSLNDSLPMLAGQQLDGILPVPGLAVGATPDPPFGTGGNQGAASVADPSSRECKPDPKLLARHNSLAAHLGIGMHERKRAMHKRGLSLNDFWGLW